MKHFRPYAAIFAALISVPFCYAETDLAPIVITATRTAQTVDESLSTVHIYTREEIARSGALSIRELLATTPGIQFTSSGGYGTASSILLRGTDNRHALILVDGIRIDSATLGGAQIQHIPLDQIERIEVVPGPRSSLYGSEAIGGIIQIFTGPKQTGPYAAQGFASHNTLTTRVGYHGSSGSTRFGIDASRLTSDGIDATTADNSGHNPDRDAYTRHALTLTLNHRLNSDGELRLRALHTRADNDYDSGPSSDHHSETLLQTLSGEWQQHLLANWTSRLSMASGRDESDDFTDAVPADHFNTKRRQLTWQNDIQYGEDRTITLGLERLREKVDSSTNYTVTQRDNRALFLQDTFRSGNHDFNFSVRRDSTDSFGAYTSWSIARGYHLHEGLRLTASYGTAFKAPTFNDLYWPGSGNPDLKVESSATSEISLRGKAWQLEIYRTDIDDMIRWAPAPLPDDPFRWSPQNLDMVRIDGAEFTWRIAPLPYHAEFNMTLLDPRNRITDKVLFYRARQTAAIRLGTDRGPYTTHLAWRYTGPRYTDGDNSHELSPYRIVDLNMEYRIDRHWTFRSQIGNLLGESYQENKGYRTLGTTVGFEVSYK